MVNSFADGKTKLVEPPYGSYVDSWQLPVNSNFGVTDAAVSGTTTINVITITPASPFVTLVFANFDTTPTPWQVPLAGQNLRIVLTGSLSFNITVYIPANVPGMWLIDNQTAGAFTATVKTSAAGSVGVNPPQGYVSYIFCDGTNVKWADAGNVAVNAPSALPAGTILPFGGPSIPAGYLPCNGSGVSRSTYANLFLAIGTTWGSGDGSTTFNLPNLAGLFLRGVGGNAGALGTTQTDQFGTHTHTVNDSGHVHASPFGNSGSNGASPGGNLAGYGTPPYGPTNTLTAVTGITISNTGGNETRPVNASVNYMIKF
jgi:microcystin-dependent protein